MTAKQSPRSFEMELDVQATPDQVWKALTDPTELMRWFPIQASVNPGEGGDMHWSWGGIHEWPQTIEVWEPGRRLRTRYESAVDRGAGKVPLFCEFQIEGRGGSTKLRMIHSGFGPEGDFDHEFDGISRGWPVELRSLKHYLENHSGKNRQLAFAVRDTELGLDDLWKRLVGPDGLACGTSLATLEVGQAFEITLPASMPGNLGGAVLSGRALTCQPREFSGVVENHGGAFLRICAENCGGTHQAWLWMAFYGDAEDDRERFQKGFEAFLERTFAGNEVKA